MSTELITNKIWNRLTKEARRHKKNSVVAVAYFSKGAASMLPLVKGSILLVDVSEKAVKSGQTCPADLLKLYYRGVKIYSKEWLHAKMFVFGRSLFIGSTNASINSTRLTEAIIKVSDKEAVSRAKEFIEALCKIELGDDQLKRLQKKYKEPRFLGPTSPRNAPRKEGNFINQSSFYIYHLERVGFTTDEKEQSKIGSKEAKGKRINPSRHRVEEFNWTSNLPARKGDVVMQITNEGGQTYVSPPGIIIHQKRWKHKQTHKTLTYLEVPMKRRKNIKVVRSTLKRQEKKLLERNGQRSSALANKLSSLWN